MDRLLQFGGAFAPPRPPRETGPTYDETMRLVRRSGDTPSLRDIILGRRRGGLAAAMDAPSGPVEEEGPMLAQILRDGRRPEGSASGAQSRAPGLGARAFSPLPPPPAVPLPSDRFGRARLVYQRLRQHGVSPAQAAGVLGSLDQESQGLDPRIRNRQGNRGLPQWSRSRWAALERWAEQNRRDPDDLITQTDYILHELHTSERPALRELLRAGKPEEAVAAFNRFERWSGWDDGRKGAEAGSRYEYAEEHFENIRAGRYD